jgi:methylthioribulose-1-phosphate dehydratase
MNAFCLRQAGACIHTHSKAAVLATLLFDKKEFVITHQEMIKGIRRGSTKENLKYYDRLVVPIIENTAQEEDLEARMAQVCCWSIDVNVKIFMQDNRRCMSTQKQMLFSFGKAPIRIQTFHSHSIGFNQQTPWSLCLGRNMGKGYVSNHVKILCWFFIAKTMSECYDYLFGIAVDMKKLGLDPTAVPLDSEYKDLVYQHWM